MTVGDSTRPLTRRTSVVIPVYNEERRLPSTLDRVLSFVGEDSEITEVIVVDDGSLDGSRELAAGFAARDRRVRVVAYEPNRGKGYAIRRGVMAAVSDAILLCDADLSTPIEELDRIAPLLSRFDVVIGSRAIDESKVALRQPWYRQFMGKTFNFLMRWITGLSFRDTQCGFKLLRRDAAQRIFAAARVDRFAFDVEMLMLGLREGFTIREEPVEWRNSPDSRVRIVQDSARMLVDIARMRFRIGHPSSGRRRESEQGNS